MSFYKKYAVITTQSSVFINKRKFPEIIERLALYKSKNKVLQKTPSIWAAIDQYGWTAFLDKSGNINKLTYKNDRWGIDSMTLMSVLGAYIEPGGYIKISNNKSNSYWVYKFDGKMSKRQTLINRIIDFQDKDNLEDVFGEIIENMMRLGTTKTEILSLVKKLFVQNILK
ncbi:hypothetical protein LCGC14_0478700 [marine sediment metagenome]|uniref:Uncharacterized protein n=1 Tax=marine sediment metagenome TaxID=412755 RepID=A0A0F9UX03_9ZZZZ